MLRLLFQTFINCSSKFAWNSSRWCSMRWNVPPCPINRPLKSPDWEINSYLSSICNLSSFFPFVIVYFVGFDSIFPWSLAPDNPTILLSSTYFAPFKILAPWLCWFKILCKVDSGDTWDWTSYAEQTPVINKRSFFDCAGLEVWSK